MIRVQISLSDEEYQAAMAESARLGIPLAEFLRCSLRSVLPAAENKPWMRYSGMVASGNSDSSRTADGFVYGNTE